MQSALTAAICLSEEVGRYDPTNMLKIARKLVKKWALLQESWPQCFPRSLYFGNQVVGEMVTMPSPNGKCLGWAFLKDFPLVGHLRKSQFR